MMDAVGMGDITLGPVLQMDIIIQLLLNHGLVFVDTFTKKCLWIVFGGPQCELQIDVSLNNISLVDSNKDQVTNKCNPSRDNIFEAEFVLTNAGINAIRINHSILVSGIDGQDIFLGPNQAVNLENICHYQRKHRRKQGQPLLLELQQFIQLQHFAFKHLENYMMV